MNPEDALKNQSEITRDGRGREKKGLFLSRFYSPWLFLTLALLLLVIILSAVIIQSGSSSSKRQMDQALQLLSEGRLEEALVLYQSVSLLEKESVLGQEAALRAHLLKNSLNQTPLPPALSQASILLMSGRVEEALAVYEALVTEKFISQEPKEGDDFASSSESEFPVRSAEYYRMGMMYIFNGDGSAEDVEKGYRYLLDLIEKFPEASERANAFYFAGVCADWLNRLGETVILWKRLINEYPDDPRVPEALFGMGYYYQHAFQKPEEAARWYRRLIEKHPNNTYSEWAGEQLRLLRKENPINGSEYEPGGSAPRLESLPGPMPNP